MPSNTYKNLTVLSTIGGYVEQLPYYLTSSFNSDDTYLDLFHQDWLADMNYFKQVYKAGFRGRYGLG